MDKKLTPMLEQYFDLKKNYPDMMLFFRLGDFYEMFDADAKEGARILGLTLTARYRGTVQETAMCGVPHHSAEQYIAKLTKAGKRVAICEQLSDPNIPGIVKRDVVKIVTPGTTLNETILEAKKNHYCTALVVHDDRFGLSFLDLATGEFRLLEIADRNLLEDLLKKLSPAEMMVEKKEPVVSLLAKFPELLVHEYSLPFHEDAELFLKRHFQVATLEAFGIQRYRLGIRAAAMLLSYVKETQKQKLAHITKLLPYSLEDSMILDDSTIRNLELFETIRDRRAEDTLLFSIDRTLTCMGGRLLRRLLMHPLKKREAIEERLNAVEELIQQPDVLCSIRAELSECYDLERLLGRIGCRTANARDLHFLKVNLMKIPGIKILLSSMKGPLLRSLEKQLSDCSVLVALLQRQIATDPAPTLTEGGMMAEGFSPELDELRSLISHGQDWLLQYQQELRQQTGISSLKVKFNKVFGYHIEVSKAKDSMVPASFELKQNLLNDSRYMTSELREFAEKYVNAEEKIKTLEYELFQKTLDEVIPFVSEIQNNAQALAMLDVLVGFAELARGLSWVKPELSDKKSIEIREGRHPVIEAVLKREGKTYISNDTVLNAHEQIVLLTGPNMAGKSSYLRQVALIVLLAHIGCFVPAKSARISILDRIFTRVGAADDLSRGQSTFMVEMIEAANILHHATDRSLIIFDELGRGTSTYDGVSIAWAILEYVAKELKAMTLFATHYHELIDVAKEMKEAKNQSIAVAEKDGEIIFLRKVVEGGIDRSYGIEVARLAGLPIEVIERSKIILQELERDRFQEEQALMGVQPSLFENAEKPVNSFSRGTSRHSRRSLLARGA